MPNALDTSGGGSPPFLFDGTSARIFPLRAHYHALVHLCDTYLNRGSEIARFRPAAPYVILSILNYGRMASSSEAQAHYGWVSQNEVFFAVPLIWEHKVRGRWAFKAFGVVAPFIYVDQPWSIEVGREVYGWPKEEAAFLRSVNSWASGSPADRESLLTLETPSYATPFAGEQISRLPLVEIDRAAPWDTIATLMKPGLDTRNPAWTPLTLGWEMLRWMTRPQLMGVALKSPLWFLDAYRGVAKRGPFPPFYTINLKQVRHLEKPEYAAYQAITAAPMRTVSINRVGVLGEAQRWLGDLTGGYRIRLHRQAAYPIAETLGLVLSSEDLRNDPHDRPVRGSTAGVPGNTRLEAFPDRLSSDNGPSSVVTLAPIMPYWMDLDMEYGVGETVMYRGALYPEWTPGSQPPVELSTAGFSPTAETPRYDVTWDSRDVPAPPFYYPKITVRVLPLAAEQKVLSTFVTNWGMPAELGTLELNPDLPTVFMVVMTSEEMTAESNNLGWWWQKQVAFLIPVRWWPRGATDPEDAVDLLASPIAFTDGQLATNIAREYGSFMVRANIVAPPDSWLDHQGPIAGRRHMWLGTEVLPALGVDAEARERVLLEVLESGATPTTAPELPVFPAAETAFSVLGLRQIRDAKDSTQPAFLEWFTQNLRARPSGAPTWTAGALTTPLEVRIHDFPQLDLVDTFGLKTIASEHAKSPLPGRGWEGTRVSVLRPVNPFWFTIDLTHVDNTVYASRSHAQLWDVERRDMPRARTPGAEAIDHALSLLSNLFQGARE